MVGVLCAQAVAVGASLAVQSGVATAADTSIVVASHDWPVPPPVPTTYSRSGEWHDFSNGGLGFSFYEAGGGPLQAGEHLGAQGRRELVAPDPTRHGVAWTYGQTGADCDQEDRRFHVDEVVYDGSTLVRFHARLLLFCRRAGVDVLDLVAVVSYHASGGVAAHSVTRGAPFDPAINGRVTRASRQVRNIGSAPLTFSPSYFTGPDASAFSVVDDSCAAGAVAIGATCTITYAIAPQREGVLTATLEIVSDFNRWSGRPQHITIQADSRPDTLPDKFGDLVETMAPARLLDTRSAVGVSTTAPLGTTSITVPIAGRLGVPARATGVLANITVTEPSTAGFVTVHPAGIPRPVVSNINFLPGDTVANMSTLALGEGGALEVFNSSGQTHVIIDVVAYLVHEADYVGGGYIYRSYPSPERFLDTRIEGSPLGQQQARFVRFADPSLPVRAVLVNVTAVEPSGPTFISTYAPDRPRPFTSTLNVERGEIRANLAVIELDALGRAAFYNNTGSTHLVVDLLGWFVTDTESTDAGRIALLDPFRDLDTRNDFGAFEPGGAWGFRYPTALAGHPVAGIVFNLTVTEPTAPGFVTMFPWDVVSVPTASNANFVAGQTVANQAWARLVGEPDNYVGLYNGSAGSTHFVLDVQAVVLG